MMIYSLRGAVFMMGAVAMVGAWTAFDRAANYKAATATVSYIDRNCDIVETTYDADFKNKESHTYRDSCYSIDEWDKGRAKLNKVVSGKAVVHIDYTAPTTGQPLSGELKFDGHDNEFYALKAGDTVRILVSNSDPAKIRKG
jgi:hypothetical protein